jgi:hypothetical protein
MPIILIYHATGESSSIEVRIAHGVDAQNVNFFWGKMKETFISL